MPAPNADELEHSRRLALRRSLRSMLLAKFGVSSRYERPMPPAPPPSPSRLYFEGTLSNRLREKLPHAEGDLFDVGFQCEMSRIQ
jgi:hypothetical protein